MLITIEQQQALIDNYAKTHNTREVIGFIDGLEALMDLIKRLDKNRK